MTIAIRYYTGTGNTARACARLAAAFTAAGHETSLAEIGRLREGGFAGVPSARPDLLVVAFPMLGFGAPQLVHAWARALPEGGGCPVSVLAVGGASLRGDTVEPGYSADATGELARVLARRGYAPAGCHDLFAPENWTQFIEPAGPDGAAVMLGLADAAADAVAADILAGREGNVRPGPGRWALKPVSFLFRSFARRFLGLVFAADAACTGCGLCARTCPAAAIRMAGKAPRTPRWNLRCQACNRCINLCPEKAIQASPVRIAVQGGLNVAALVAVCILAGPASAALGFGGAAGTALAWAGGAAAFTLFTVVQLGPFEALLARFGRTPAGRRFFAAGSWTRGWRRYLAPGFSPRPPA